jgi:hypothetical protein
MSLQSGSAVWFLRTFPICNFAPTGGNYLQRNGRVLVDSGGGVRSCWLPANERHASGVKTLLPEGRRVAGDQSPAYRINPRPTGTCGAAEAFGTENEWFRIGVPGWGGAVHGGSKTKGGGLGFVGSHISGSRCGPPGRDLCGASIRCRDGPFAESGPARRPSPRTRA